MVRGAEYDNGVPQSDNAIEAGETKAHGVGNNDAPLNHTQKVAPMPEETGSQRNDVFPGFSGARPNHSGSGKGGHEPKTLGENKGLGSQPGV
ncbi:hypothetical protein N7504_001591 [Penicillium tannophilum]|uniref:Uncharacterized protein n=1 Tax=Penicillium frequentans TaxID=3151616 RepID=A0AAD6CKW9_9EURO|nr:uncharacterized protein N7503_011677 [Penicillium pulvis]KAJ5524129.1 hypothetical protein N7494_010779 [Penicillium glabrum]KAJ5536063.1 hypothetical protein N7513_009249 [Penicillium glabrum]KAJ5786465.1 hypothetical protein N7503_011677 [Penicillium pulvis]KAJ5912708.1 hypothetical protein N7504_001591 [Penicillium tannophilum]